MVVTCSSWIITQFTEGETSNSTSTLPNLEFRLDKLEMSSRSTTPFFHSHTKVASQGQRTLVQSTKSLGKGLFSVAGAQTLDFTASRVPSPFQREQIDFQNKLRPHSFQHQETKITCKSVIALEYSARSRIAYVQSPVEEYWNNNSFWLQEAFCMECFFPGLLKTRLAAMV